MENLTVVISSVLIGTLAAIVYSLRMIVRMNQKIDLIMEHLDISNKLKENL